MEWNRENAIRRYSGRDESRVYLVKIRKGTIGELIKQVANS